LAREAVVAGVMPGWENWFLIAAISTYAEINGRQLTNRMDLCFPTLSAMKLRKGWGTRFYWSLTTDH
jgi:hypothetical protein